MPPRVKTAGVIPRMLMVAVVSLLCLGGAGSPLPHGDECVKYSKELLKNVTTAVEKIDFFCPNTTIETNKKTFSVCEPKNSACLSHPTNRFNKDACLSLIREDLQYYREILSAFHIDSAPDIQGRARGVQGHIDNLVKNCAFPPVRVEPSMETVSVRAAIEELDTFKKRVHLCRVLLSFRVRTVTLTRAMSYMAAGDHL